MQKENDGLQSDFDQGFDQRSQVVTLMIYEIGPVEFETEGREVKSQDNLVACILRAATPLVLLYRHIRRVKMEHGALSTYAIRTSYAYRVGTYFE